ncbi:DUF4333 domain-containing protein [Nocardioides sp. W3-2-3]|uniref:DUF4333 domain-containing protein n=1 Tax=Nocardioides convexus TaxID=2712224 RepID=UPI002418AD36|nr:DUF4333 domain-containing protein [Nocardioides convexus]NGZ99565.1 DUF4333 domain-containing protein [Nocardioides convexus]
MRTRPYPSARQGVAALAASLVLLTAVGCDASVSAGEKKVSRSDVARQVSEQTTRTVGQEPDDVSCPDDLPAEKGAETTCTLTSGGSSYDVAVKVTSVDGDDVKLDIKVADAPSRWSLKNGVQVASPTDGAKAGALLADVLVVLTATAAVVLALPREPLGVVAGGAVLAWVGIAWLYGFLLFFVPGRRSLGCALFGTRVVRRSDGAWPGFWRSGWISFVRTVWFPLLPPVVIAGALGGGSPGGIEAVVWNVSVRATGLTGRRPPGGVAEIDREESP